MLRLLIIVLVVVAALLRGGSLHNVTTLRLRWPALALAGLGLQLLLFTPFTAAPLVTVAVPSLYVLSMLLLVGWVLLNRHIPGMTLMGVGLALNTLAIIANGGYMPADPRAVAFAGRAAAYGADGSAVYNNSIAAGEGVRLWLLTDILPLPAWVPLANVYSIGDVLIELGAALLCWKTLLRRPQAPAEAVAAPPANAP